MAITQQPLEFNSLAGRDACELILAIHELTGVTVGTIMECIDDGSLYGRHAPYDVLDAWLDETMDTAHCQNTSEDK